MQSSIIGNGNAKLCLLKSVFYLYNQMVINQIKSRPHILNRLSLNEKGVILFFACWLVRKYALAVQDDVSFLPFAKVLGLLVNLPENIAAEHHFLAYVLSFLPLCLLKFILESQFACQNLLEDQVIHRHFLQALVLFHVQE